MVPRLSTWRRHAFESRHREAFLSLAGDRDTIGIVVDYSKDPDYICDGLRGAYGWEGSPTWGEFVERVIKKH